MLHILFVLSLSDELNCLSVCPLISSIDSHNPSFGSESLSKVVQFEVFIAWIDFSHIVESLWFSICCIDFPSSIITQTIHERVLHGRQNMGIDSIPVSSNIIFLFYMWVHTSSDSDHPQEFVDIVSAVSANSTVNN